MLVTTADTITSTARLMALWKHECNRVISDRFTTFEDIDWFENAIKMVRNQFKTQNCLSQSILNCVNTQRRS